MPPDHRFTVNTKIASFAVTIRDGAVVRIGLNERADRNTESPLERRVSAELQEYAAGERRDFTFPIAPEGTLFDRSVWTMVSDIPYGETKTYGEIASALGKPGAARAVGTANGRNPVPPVIPCHRVVAVGGKLGGYGGGLELKRRLLDLETVRRVSGAFGVLACCAAMLFAAAACTEPSRPVFVEPEDAVDTLPPNIAFLTPPIGDSIFPADTLIRVTVLVRDPSVIRSVASSVVGEIVIQFDTELPMDTVFTIQYPIPVDRSVNGRLEIIVVATDTLLNLGRAARAFIIE